MRTAARPREFPRDKPCGGGVTRRGHGSCRSSSSRWSSTSSPTPTCASGYGRPARGAAGRCVYMTQRRRGSTISSRSGAAEAGAEFRDGVRVTGDEVKGEVTVAARRRGFGPMRWSAPTASTGSRASPRSGASRRRRRARRKPAVARSMRGAMRPRRARARDRPPGVRLGVPEGRPRQRRHRRLGVEGPGSARALAASAPQHGIRRDLEEVRGYRLPLRPRSDARARPAP